MYLNLFVAGQCSFWFVSPARSAFSHLENFWPKQEIKDLSPYSGSDGSAHWASMRLVQPNEETKSLLPNSLDPNFTACLITRIKSRKWEWEWKFSSFSCLIIIINLDYFSLENVDSLIYGNDETFLDRKYS